MDGTAQPPWDDHGGAVADLRHWRESAAVLSPHQPPEQPPEHPPEPPPPEDGGSDRLPPEDPATALPDGCPVIPLGVLGDVYYYLDQMGQLRDLKARDHSRLNVQSLFGRLSELLEDFWPRQQQDPNTKEWYTTGWKPEKAAESLMRAAAARGAWSPFDRVREAGAWPGADGELVLHVGDALLIVPPDRPRPGERPWREIPCGVYKGFVYPTAPPTMRPDLDTQPAGPRGPAAKVDSILRTWALRRPDLDTVFILGWLASAMLGGAVKWRVQMWTTGDYGTGKSSFQNVIKWLMGENGIVQTSDPSAAGIRQLLRHSSRPIAIDEAEAEEDNRRMNQLIKLARDAASGALALRGGSDHNAATFTLRSSFLFTSILIPPLLPQDRSRLAVIDLLRLPEGGKPPRISQRSMAALGAALLRRLVDNWWRWDETIEAYRDCMASVGHSARGQDVYGTLLAAFDLLMFDVVPDPDSLRGWQDRMAAEVVPELRENNSDADSCLTRLLTSVLENPRDRMRETVGWWICRAAGIDPGGSKDEITADDRRRADKVLSLAGLRLVQADFGDGPQPYVAIANMHTGLARIFEGTQWGDRPGADGVWRQSLSRLVDDQRQCGVQIWFGKNIRSTLLPLHLCLPELTAPAGRPITGPTTPEPSFDLPGAL